MKGLDYLHSVVGIIHRDIKAGNMFLNDNGELKIGDFGVSALLDKPGASASTFIGTPYWMAPEVISTGSESTGKYDSKADIWSIGITAIELADKNPPLSDIHPMRALLMIPTIDLNFQKPKNYSKQFQDFVQMCLLKDPKKRPFAIDLLNHGFIQKSHSLPRQKVRSRLNLTIFNRMMHQYIYIYISLNSTSSSIPIRIYKYII